MTNTQREQVFKGRKSKTGKKIQKDITQGSGVEGTRDWSGIGGQLETKQGTVLGWEMKREGTTEEEMGRRQEFWKKSYENWQL